MKPKAIGQFGQWLLNKIKEQDITMKEVSSLLKCSRTTVNGHTRELIKPSFVYVMAYCQILGGDPEEVWEMVEKDWAGSGKHRNRKSNLWFDSKEEPK